LLNRITGNKVDQQEHDAHHQPDDRNHVEQPGCEASKQADKHSAFSNQLLKLLVVVQQVCRGT
jgi:hypothetical protein